MDLHELSFAKIIILREDIAEVIINEYIEMDEFSFVIDFFTLLYLSLMKWILKLHEYEHT